MTSDNRNALDRRLAEERFRKLYAAHLREVLAYAVRRTADAEDAADAVAEAFLVAWRRLPDVPPGDEARPWLYGVARRTLANQRRGEQRRHRLADRLRDDLAAVAARSSGEERDERLESALDRLDPDDREILRLSAWEELTPSQAARVLGISAIAARSRLHRARRRLRRALAERHSDLAKKTSLQLKEEP
ncbi:MAG TPA: sigma-70 family RNA polymerase sigma factor [Solirubrobacterales bacterium]|nr:sigma-70 family RNA polymerase sigma factor [Solirubrobacterales bacterium]